jgi:O-antigen ligase
MLIAPGAWDWRGLKPLAILLGLFAASIAVQLIPLPPAVWAALPGRQSYLQAAIVAGIEQPWRPISLVPYRTANSLLATLPAFAGLIALAGIPRTRWPVLAGAITILCCASAVLGVLQFGTEALYPYNPSDTGLPIGLLANRNHQALLLAIGILFLAQWGMRRDGKGQETTTRAILAVAMILVLITVILLTGSRAGLALMIVSVSITAIAAGTRMLRDQRRSPLRLLLVIAPFAMIALGAYAARNSSVVRLSHSIGDIGDDMRLLALPTVWKMAWHFFPAGAGFGTFDVIFMQFEPEALLKRTFFNRAHSDPLEVMITGGLPSLTIVAAFLIWLGYRAMRALASETAVERRADRLSGVRSAVLAILLALAASLIDYPLRTPILSLVFVLLCGLCYRDPGVTARLDRREGLPEDFSAPSGDFIVHE